MAHVFRFDHTWRVPAAPDQVFTVLEDAENYARWWPQVRRVRAVDDDSGEAEVRSLLPFTLRLVLRRVAAERSAGRLEVEISGDLHGRAGWVVRPLGGGSVADFHQEVILAHASLAPWARLGGPVLRWNHAWMMSSGRRGLSAYVRQS